MKPILSRRLMVGSTAATCAWHACLQSGRAERKPDSLLSASQFSNDDWPWWRGPNFTGIASSDQNPPIHWSDSKNVLWKSPLPGRGHGSASMVGDRIFLVTAEHDHQTQSLHCLERATGKRLWATVVHEGGFDSGGNGKSTLASCTPACDGEKIYVNFLNRSGIHASSLDLSGKILWQTKVSDYVIHQGFGASPAIYDSLVIVSADHKGAGAIAGLSRDKGEIVWKISRPKLPNYASPIILRVAGREQLLFTGCNLVTSLNPKDGKKFWEANGSTEECVTSVVADGDLIFTSGGYPKNHISAFRADGSGKLVWEIGNRVYVPSLLAKDGYLYGVLDAGVASCWRCSDGHEMWKGRLSGTFSSSPVMVGDRVYATNETGTTYVFKANPEKFESIAENQLGDEVFATPTICGGRIYTRVAVGAGEGRREWLYCLGEK